MKFTKIAFWNLMQQYYSRVAKWRTHQKLRTQQPALDNKKVIILHDNVKLRQVAGISHFAKKFAEPHINVLPYSNPSPTLSHSSFLISRKLLQRKKTWKKEYLRMFTVFGSLDFYGNGVYLANVLIVTVLILNKNRYWFSS